VITVGDGVYRVRRHTGSQSSDHRPGLVRKRQAA
jgi:hypothetical protein